MKTTEVSRRGRMWVMCEHNDPEYDGRDMYYVYCKVKSSNGGAFPTDYLCGSLACVSDTGEYEDNNGFMVKLTKEQSNWLANLEEKL